MLVVVEVLDDRKCCFDLFDALSFTAPDRSSFQNGMIMLPPSALPFDGQVTQVDPVRVDHEPSPVVTIRRQHSPKKRPQRLMMT